LEAWLRHARPGDAFEYYRGLLGPARCSLGPIKAERQRRALERLAETAWDLAESGRVHLVQRKLGPGSFSYLAIARAKLEAGQ
jgi:hypothetical protein